MCTCMFVITTEFCKSIQNTEMHVPSMYQSNIFVRHGCMWNPSPVSHNRYFILYTHLILFDLTEMINFKRTVTFRTSKNSYIVI